MNHAYALAPLLAAISLAACTSMAPPHTTPELPAQAEWQWKNHAHAPTGWISTAARQSWAEGRWWELLQDPGLNALMPELEQGNQTLAAALARQTQAEALLRQSQAALLPTLGAGLNANRSRAGGESAALNLNASWAPDLWGRLGDAARAQSANVQASQADLAAARLAAQAALAQAYFSVRQADAELALLADIIKGYEQAERITHNRYQAGLAAHTDLLQARNTLESARASRASLQRSRAQAEHAAALLLGRPPASFSLPVAEWAPNAPQVPLALPAELLLRRPDVAAAERAVAAANARIGMARAAFFPNLTLNAQLGGTASAVSQLFSAPTLAWSLGAALAQTLLDGGARSAALDEARAAHLAASAQYRQTVLAAMTEVEDALTALGTLHAQMAHTRAASQAATEAERRIHNRYLAGLAAYTEVVNAQASVLGSRRSLLQLQLQRQLAAIGLLQSLGGGWQPQWQTPPVD